MPKAYNDIPGCNPDTVQKAITTNRHLNPLDPKYQFPGHSEGLDHGFNAYGPEGCSMAKPKMPAKKLDDPQVSLPPRSQTSYISKRSQIPQNKAANSTHPG
jgi:hypothetical protein